MLQLRVCKHSAFSLSPFSRMEGHGSQNKQFHCFLNPSKIHRHRPYLNRTCLPSLMSSNSNVIRFISDIECLIFVLVHGNYFAVQYLVTHFYARFENYFLSIKSQRPISTEWMLLSASGWNRQGGKLDLLFERAEWLLGNFTDFCSTKMDAGSGPGHLTNALIERIMCGHCGARSIFNAAQFNPVVLQFGTNGRHTFFFLSRQRHTASNFELTAPETVII